MSMLADPTRKATSKEKSILLWFRKGMKGARNRISEILSVVVSTYIKHIHIGQSQNEGESKRPLKSPPRVMD